MKLEIRLRTAEIHDLTEMQRLFADTISSVCSADYNPNQIKVWTASIENHERWQEIITHQFTLLAILRKQIVGFATLDQGDYLDFLYIHKDFQRQGIALMLYKHIEQEAIKQGKSELTSDVSKTAKPFFEKMGFEVIAEQTIERQGVLLNNFKMKKTLKTTK